MRQTPIIHYTTDYSLFKNFKSNRASSEKWINRLVSSPTFEEGIMYNPIIVNEKMRIVDGQHRLAACREKKIPVYYVIYPGSDENTMAELNVNMHSWQNIDYLQHFSETKESYAFIRKIKEKFKTTVSVILFILPVFNTKQNFMKVASKFKDGELDIMDIAPQIEMFFNQYFSTIRKYRSVVGKKCSPLFNRIYSYCFAKLFRDNPVKFKKLLEKIQEKDMIIPNCADIESAEEIIENIFNSKKTKV